jgi:hypothetical protein
MASFSITSGLEELSAGSKSEGLCRSAVRLLKRMADKDADRLWDPLRADPAFQKLCEEKQP